ncbi:MAG: hypothetical protein OXG74_02610 [Acidobacteria bacterium]|nr:hypothetical protein [Acidobacteriota bacterium]
MFTNPGSRVDLLLTLARLALPDAVRRSNQPVAVAILVGLLFLVFATVATLALLPVIFAIESDALRRNLLNLIACSVTALALLAQVALRAPVTWLLDLEDLLRLPVGFRDLYGLRFVLSTIGYWLPVLGPAGVYLTVMRSGGVSGVPVTLFGILSLVWIFGRTAAILWLLANRSVEGGLGTLAMVVIMAAGQGAILFGSLALGGEVDSEGITGALEKSAVLGGLGYTPPGLVAAIVHDPGPSLPNLARLGGLMAILGALVALENRLLLRSYLERPGSDRRVAPGVLPLTRGLRRWRRLTPVATLSALETECLLRLKPARLLLAITAAFALVWIPALAGLTVGLAGLIGLAIHGFRVEKQPPTCHVWRESLGLPLTVPQIFRATGRAPALMSVPILVFVLGLTPLDWFGWGFFLVASCLVLAGLLLADAAYGLIQVYWPQRSAGPSSETNAAKFAASLLIPQIALAPALLSFALYILYARERLSALTAGFIAVAVLLLAAAAAFASRRRQDRVLNARGPELLLADPPEAPPTPSDHAPDRATAGTVQGPGTT